jgi:hypothetical protein
VKTKAPEAGPACDLYLSPLFGRRRRYAESSGRPWYILSAEHGLLDPGSIIGPYDVHLADQSADYRLAWGEWVAAKLARVRGPVDGVVIEVHAGQAYVDAIEEPLRRRGAVLLTPLTGLRSGEQLAWYDGLGGEPRPQELAVAPVPGDGQQLEDLVILDGPHETGAVHVSAANRDRGLRSGVGSHGRGRWAAAPGASRAGNTPGVRHAAAAQRDVCR